MILYFSSLKETKLQEWHIKSLERSEVTEPSHNFDVRDQDEVNNSSDPLPAPAVPSVIVVPPQNRFGGIRVTPIVTPLTLAMVNRDLNGTYYLSRSSSSRENSGRFRNEVNNS